LTTKFLQSVASRSRDLPAVILLMLLSRRSRQRERL